MGVPGFAIRVPGRAMRADDCVRRADPIGPRAASKDDGVGESEPYWLYGLHAVRAALANPKRTIHRFVATQNAVRRLEPGADAPEPEIMDVKRINRLLGEAVHQGAAILTDPLEAGDLGALASARCVLCLDHITDPHNVGAILRSAAAFAADAVVTTTRHSAPETGALAKAASGALDQVPMVRVVNLSRAIAELREFGLLAVAMDSGAEDTLRAVPTGVPLALVLGAEDKGVRPGVAAQCDRYVRIEVPGALASLNVSNAAAIALYEAARSVGRGA